MSYDSAGRVQKRVVDSLVLGIRNAFVGHVKYPYLETGLGEFDFDNSRIFIADVMPLESVAYPCVIVDSVPGEEERYLGPDMLRDQISPSVGGITLTETVNFSSIPLTASIRIYTRDTITQDDLNFAVYDTLKINKDVLATNGVEIVQTKWLAPSREFRGDRWWIVSTISMDLYCEWSNITPLTVVSGVNLTNVWAYIDTDLTDDPDVSSEIEGDEIIDLSEF